MECEPGQEAQIDYGTLYLPIGNNGRRRKVHVLIVTCQFALKMYHLFANQNVPPLGCQTSPKWNFSNQSSACMIRAGLSVA
jgi:hypothetical protein